MFSRIQGNNAPKSCSLALAAVLSPVYTSVTRQWVYMPQYKCGFKIRLTKTEQNTYRKRRKKNTGETISQ
jgi:hypothetical protein